MNYGKCKQCGRVALLGSNGICGRCYEMQRLKEENERLRKENQYLKDTACEIMEEELYIEPCPICGQRMVANTWGPEHDEGNKGNCPYCSSLTTEAHNVIARVLREAKKQVTMFPNDTTVQLKAVVIDLLKLQAKVRGESE